MRHRLRSHRQLTRPGIFVLGAVAVALLAPSAAADTTAPLYAKMKQRFTTAKPGHSTGWSFDGALKPFPAGEQVPPQRTLKLVFPRGTRFDLRGVANCDATDERSLARDSAPAPLTHSSARGRAPSLSARRASST